MKYVNTTATSAYLVIAGRYRELRLRGAERGLTTTEIAVLTFVLVTMAGLIGVLLYNFSAEQVEALNEFETPELG